VEGVTHNDVIGNDIGIFETSEISIPLRCEYYILEIMKTNVTNGVEMSPMLLVEGKERIEGWGRRGR
jgi:hypothetical protein